MPATIDTIDIKKYESDGFLMVEDLVSESELGDLQTRLREYTHGGRSTEKLSIQTEPRVTRGELQVDHPGDGIRKIDGLVESDDLFLKLGKHRNVLRVLEQILGIDIKMFRNGVLHKAPGVGSVKGVHQDSPYWPIEPMSLCSCWFAIDDATPENGCMMVIRGGHKLGPLPHKKITDDFVIEESQYKMADLVTVPMKAGAGLFFHSLLPHYTAPNDSTTWRRAIALSYMSSRSWYTGEGESREYFHIQGKSFAGCVR